MLLISIIFYFISGLFCGQFVFNIVRFYNNSDTFFKEIKILDIISITITLLLYIFMIVLYNTNNIMFIENYLTITILVISTIISALFRAYLYFYKKDNI